MNSHALRHARNPQFQDPGLWVESSRCHVINVDEDELFLPNIEPNRGIFVQFTLNGLGNLTGGGLSNLLSDGIWGFRETEYGQ